MTTTPIADSLTSRTTRAARWRLAGAIVGALSQFVVGILLARLLTPADFGVTALAVVVLGLARPLRELGIGDAVVQRPSLTDRHVRTAFTFSTLVGLMVAAVVIVMAPLGTSLMHDASLAPVLRVLAAGFAVRGAAIVAEALLRRHLDFKKQMLIESGSYLVGYGGVAVTMALLGQGLWSLVWGSLVETVLWSGAQLAVVRHRIRPLLARRELAELLRFGIGSAMSSFANYFAVNGDYFVVGWSMGAVNLGLYVRAYGLMRLPHTYASTVLSRVMFPAFARVQAEPARLRRGYLLLTEVVAMLAAPSMATMAIVAPHFVHSLYGAQWSGVVVPLQILCLAGYFRALYHPSGIVAQSVGRVYAELWRQVSYAAMVIVGALVGSHYGLPGVAVAVSAAILYMFVVSGHLALRATGATWGAYLRVQRGALVTAGATCAVTLSVRLLLEASRASSGFITLAVLVAATVPSSVGLVWMLARPECEPLLEWLPAWGARFVQAVGGSRAIGWERWRGTD